MRKLLAAVPLLVGLPGTDELAAQVQPGSAPGHVRVCVVTNSGPTWVAALFREAVGDTVVPTLGGPVPWREHYAHTGMYAAGRAWYEEGDSLVLPTRYGSIGGRSAPVRRRAGFMRLHGSRTFTPDSLEAAGTGLVYAGSHDGVPLFAERGTALPPQLYLVPVRPGCEFQPYTPTEYIDVG